MPVDIYLNDIYITTVYVDKNLDYDDAVLAAREQIDLFFDVIADE